ncbi:putative DNA modification/repair radical SAM protein [Hydrogenoanaerobacterium saccharovorans]|uniref:Putative DNA modification/repair radical SAM protein n=1 Tax=Hydrogenoanaerobacterium saccharovorans TaxID=474960 RepID=A0A1H7Z789_9FIRM|nr:putative DNA modification/repair radical SAM protein [Hydrogenoanaerobacterium saccharovorans]RPF48791.1 putative DNA modification/repair radical SAM protein [Hydrogenoanaerobacterium saccharovorans]SEM54155.1 putative DNA modification/repair radical SAM protein [Hydrogenoanaerobacterium saccharovorans]
MNIFDKLTILSDAAKYDAACTSSGADRRGGKGGIGSAVSAGICHSFAADGRCISLLKVLFTNCCIYDCKYCINRVSNDTRRAVFTPRELADLTIHFYRRNYIEGLFLSSGVIKSPNFTCEQLIETLSLLRNEYNFRGYIHVKAIPGADDALIQSLGLLADRMSVNIELPSQDSLKLLAPDKSKVSILRPMSVIQHKIAENTTDLIRYRHAPKFSPAGQSTQMIIGATPDSDFKILNLTQNLYRKFGLKRVFFSAYTPVQSHSLLPSLDTKPPLLREHRLYQADWLLRFYGFDASELLDEQHQNFNPYIDPKCNWALNHMDMFPVEINTAPYDTLLRVPGIGVKSAQRILLARRATSIDFTGLKKIGIVLKRAQYFITCNGKIAEGLKITPEGAMRALISERCAGMLPAYQPEQLSLFTPQLTREDVIQCLTGEL